MKNHTFIVLASLVILLIVLSADIFVARANNFASVEVSFTGIIQSVNSFDFTITVGSNYYFVANSFGIDVYNSTSFDSAMYYAVASCPASRGSIYLTNGTFYSHDLEFDYSGAYKYYGPSTNRNNITICGSGNTTVIQMSYAESVLLSDPKAGQYTVTVQNASGFAVNDRCYILNDDNGNGIWDSGEAWEATQIASISGNNLTMYSSLGNSYAVTKHAYIAIMNDGFCLINSNNWVIENLTINGNAQNSFVGHHGHAPDNWWGFGIVFNGYNDSAISVNILNTNVDNIELDNASQCTIDNCYIKTYGVNTTYFTGAGILIYAQTGDTYNNLIKNNVVVGSNSTHDLIEMDGYSSTYRVWGNTVLNNTCDTAWLEALVLWHNCQNNIISGNTFENISTWVIDSFGTPAGNPFTGQSTASGNTVEYNQFINNPEVKNGIWDFEVHLGDYSQNNQFENNYFEFGTVTASLLATGNIFTNNSNFVNCTI